MTTKVQTRKAQKVGAYHDKYHRLYDNFRRECLPLLDLDNTADAQIAELAEDIVTCLGIRRQELHGYDPSGNDRKPGHS